MAMIKSVENYKKEREEQTFFNRLEQTVDHFLVTWTIDELLKVSQFREKSFTSPPFQIHSETWIIIVFPEFLCSDEKVVKFCLIRDDIGDKSCSITVTYRFGIKESKITWFEEQREISFALGSTDSTVGIIPKIFHNAVTENKLTVVCEMYIAYSAEAAEQVASKEQPRESLDLIKLSLDLLNCCKKVYEADLTLRRKNFADIHAHKAILSARSPVFAKMIGNEPFINIPEDDYDHIHNILMYIYSGRFTRIAFGGISIGLYECAQRYKLDGLTQILAPSEICVSSILMENDISFTWKIENFDTYKMKRDECITSPSFHAGFKDSLVWYLDIYPEGSSRALDSVGIYIRTEYLKTISDVKLRVSILDEFKQEHCKKYTYEPLYPNFIYGFPDFVSKKELKDKGLLNGNKIIINCKIFCGTLVHSFDKTSILSQTSFLEYPGLEQLSSDLEKVFRTGVYSDASLVVDRTVFLVHKVIIYARSPLLALLLKSAEDKGCVVDITDTSAPVLEALLLYVYTGKLKNIDKHFIVNLYAVAEHYSMISLVNSCISVLLGSLDNKCVCDVILLADKYKSRTLMIACLHYLKVNAKEILKSTEWQNFMTIQKNLSLKIKEWLENPTNECLENSPYITTCNEIYKYFNESNAI